MILVLTAGFGDGHNTAAFSTAQAVRHLCPGEEVEVCDLFSESMPTVSGVFKSLYQQAITHLPAAWRLVYRMLERMDMDPQASPWLLPLLRGLRLRLHRQQPRLIISTYPIYAALLEALAAQGAPLPPLVTIITDSISVHPIWTLQPSQLWCVADEETRGVVENMGVPAEKIRVTGFPVSLQFTEPLPSDSPQRGAGRMTESRQECLHHDSPQHGAGRILYLPSTPARHVEATLHALKPLLESGVRLTLPVGKHSSRLYHALRRYTDAWPAAPLDILGWTDRIPELLRTHDVVICKAGGAILHEVLAARIPAVIDYVVPGQEEGNAEMLLCRESALRSHTPRQTAEAVGAILAQGCQRGRQMSENMAPISVPDAALITAQAALEVAEKAAHPSLPPGA